MKTFGIIFLIIGITTCSLAQEINLHKNKLSLKPQKVELKLDSYLLHHDGENALTRWKNNPFVQNDFNNLKSKAFKIDKNRNYTPKHSSAFLSTMPVYKPNQSYHMQSIKPDTSVYYHMLVQKIEVSQRKESDLP